MLEITTAGQRISKWGEGPIWHGDALFYVDIEDHAVIRFDPETEEETVWNVGERVGAVVPRAEGGLIIAGDNGFQMLDTDTGELTPICDPEPDKPNNRFNDGKCSPDGRFYAGSISLVKNTGDAALYRLDTDRSCHLVLPELTNSNGIVWSLDGQSVYHIDTPTKTVVCYGYDAESGEFEGGEIVINTQKLDASPDGMAIDNDGKLWVTFCHGACVKQYDPTTGEELQHIALPCLETTSCAFGGPTMQDLYVTTGIHKTEVEENAGRLFVVKGLTSQGKEGFTYAG